MSSAWIHTDSASPVPRSRKRIYREFCYPLGRAHRLPLPQWPRGPSIKTVLATRRSERPSAPPTLEQLATVLWSAGKVLDLRLLSEDVLWQHRAPPSAGGIHPIDLLVVSTSYRIALYDGISHSLWRLVGLDQKMLSRLLRPIRLAVGPLRGDVLLFAAQFGRTLAKYRHGESLVWRDAGALVATIGFACNAIGIKCTPIGPTGEPLLSQLLGGAGAPKGVGGCVIGR